MNKTTIKTFIAWLEAASYEEILSHKETVLASLDAVSSPSGKADVRLALRLIDEEILARLELGQMTRSQ
jgi:hypothetical protein